MTRKSLRKTNKMGRPPGSGKVLTNAKPLIEALRAGLPVKMACHKANVSPYTYHEWLKLGDEGKTPVYVEFAREARAARTAFAEDLIEGIKEAARSDPKNWTAGAWLLERMFHEEFARRNPDVAVAIQNNTTVGVVNSPEVKDLASELCSIIRRTVDAEYKEENGQ